MVSTMSLDLGTKTSFYKCTPVFLCLTASAILEVSTLYIRATCRYVLSEDDGSLTNIRNGLILTLASPTS